MKIRVFLMCILIFLAIGRKVIPRHDSSNPLDDYLKELLAEQ